MYCDVDCECYDEDGDGYFEGSNYPYYCECFPDYDCLSSDASVHPGASEVCNALDDDCDGETDEGAPVLAEPDLDGDGFGDCAAIGLTFNPDDENRWGYTEQCCDCDDANPSASPSQVESCDGVDNDCDGTMDEECTSDTAE